MSGAPVQRVVLWGLLVATLLAIAVTAVMAPKWSRPVGGKSAPPILGSVPVFELIDHQGRTWSNTDLVGAPWIADFIFTRCGLSCPRMTALMAQLGEVLPDQTDVYRVSVSVDPEHDRPEILKSYAEKWGVKEERWLFLTGDREQIRELVIEGFKLGLDMEPPAELASPEEPIIHSTRFVLVDRKGSIRGYYNVVEGGELERLIIDLQALLQS